MPFARAILWAQWRTLRNYYPHSGVAWTAIVGLIWYGLWAAASLALIRVFSEASNAQIIHNVLPSSLLIAFLYWQVIPLLMATPGATLELKKLRAYPIPESQLFSVEVLLRFTSGIEMVLLLTGGTIGMLLNPAMPKWGGLGTLAYVLFNLLTALGMRDMLARLLSRKRIREVAFLFIVICAALPQLLLTRSGGGSFRILRFLGARPWWGFPWTAASNFLLSIEPLRSAGILLLWLIAVGLFAKWQFKRTLRFDADAAGSGSQTNATQTGLLEHFYQLPSSVFGDPMGALIEKEFRFLLRSPRFRIVFLMGFTFGLLIWLPMAVGYGGYRFGPISDNGLTPFFFRNYLTVVSVYSMLLLSEICFWNSFGFDRSAAQFYFLAPVSFTRVLIAKNLTAMFFILLEISIVTLVCALLGMPLGAQRLIEAFLVACVVSFFLLSAGNMQSIREARGVNPATTFRSGAAGRMQAVLFIIYPITFAPVALAYLARYAFKSQPAFYGVLAIDAVVGYVLYRIALDAAAASAERLKEKMIAALSTSDGPIAD
jgi:ABC-2 type transport system permease protein